MNKTRWFTLCLVLGVLVVWCRSPVAGPIHPVSAETQPAASLSPRLGPFFDIWTDGLTNDGSSVAYNSQHDEYLVVWYTVQGTNTWDIWARRVGSDGSLKSWFNVDTIAGVKLWGPAVAYSPVQDEYLIVYTCEHSTTNYDIWARRINWDSPGASARIYLDTSGGKQQAPNVAYNSQDDEYLVVWQSETVFGMAEVVARRVKASDGTLYTRKVIATGTNQYRGQPDVAYNAARNNYLIAYSYEDLSGPGDVWGQVISADLASHSPEFQFSGTPTLATGPAVAAGPDEYLVVWRQFFPSLDHRVYGRRVAYDGTPQGPSKGFPVATTTTTTTLRSPGDVAYGAGFGYLVTSSYFNPTSADESDVYGRYVMPGQDQAAGDEFAIDTGPHFQGSPAVACAPSGDCLVAESDNPFAYPWGDKDIRGRFVNPWHIHLPVGLRTFP